MKTSPSPSTLLHSSIAFLALLLAADRSRADDHGDTLATATAWNANTADVSGTLESATDADWFRLTVSVPGRVWIYSSGGTDVSGTLYDAGGTQIIYDLNGGDGYNFEWDAVMAAGTYYLQITSGASALKTGAYALHMRSPQGAVDFASPNLNASLTKPGEIHLYRLTTPAAGRAWFYTAGLVDTTGVLFDAGGTQVIYDYNSGDSYNFAFDLVLPADKTYYLMLRGGSSATVTGAYTLSQRLYSNALPLSGTSRPASLENGSDLDLYRLDIGRSGPVWVYSTGSTDTSAVLYDTGGTQVTYDYNSGAGDNFLFSNVLAAGTYYLLVSGGGTAARTGAYQLEVRQPATAQILPSGTSAHSIGVPGDRDVYAFQTSGTVNISSTGTTDVAAVLYDSGGQQVTYDYNSNGAGNFRFTRTLAAGTYYLLVSGESADIVTGNYSLTASSTGGFGGASTVSSTAVVANGTNTGTLTVSAIGAWSVTGLPSWASAAPAGGNGQGDVQFTFQPNTTGSTRTATVMAGGMTVTLSQPPASVHLNGPGLTISDAVLLSIRTSSGVTYRIESSPDLRTWTATGVTIAGDGSEKSVCLPRSGGRGWFRASAIP